MKIPWLAGIRNHKTWLWLGVLAALILILLLLASIDLYPIATVNGSPVSARRFWKNYRAAGVYYENALKTYGPENKEMNGVPLAELEAQVLDRLVESELLRKGAEQEVGGDLDYLVSSKLSRLESDQDLRQASEALYKMSYDDFRSEVLVPQAVRDVLAGRLYLKGENIEEWTLAARKSAEVTILSKKFEWDGEKVVPR